MDALAILKDGLDDADMGEQRFLPLFRGAASTSRSNECG
jgi:hypothetical protein